MHVFFPNVSLRPNAASQELLLPFLLKVTTTGYHCSTLIGSQIWGKVTAQL